MFGFKSRTLKLLKSKFICAAHTEKSALRHDVKTMKFKLAAPYGVPQRNENYNLRMLGYDPKP